MFTARCDKPQVRLANSVCRRPRRVIKHDSDSHRGSHRPLTRQNAPLQAARTAPRGAPQGPPGQASRGRGCQAARGAVRAVDPAAEENAGRRIFWALRASLSPVTTHRSDVSGVRPSSARVVRAGLLPGGRCSRGQRLAPRVPGRRDAVPGLHRRAVPGRLPAPSPPLAAFAEFPAGYPRLQPKIILRSSAPEPKIIRRHTPGLLPGAPAGRVMPGQRLSAVTGR